MNIFRQDFEIFRGASRTRLQILDHSDIRFAENCRQRSPTKWPGEKIWEADIVPYMKFTIYNDIINDICLHVRFSIILSEQFCLSES